MSIWSIIREIVVDVPLGAILRILGASPARDRTNSVAFTIALIALSAKMAKADGQVTQDEVDAFQDILHIPPEDHVHVARLFDQAKRDVAGFDAYARQVERLFRDQPLILEDVLDGLFHIAKADNIMHPAEDEFLEEVARIFGIAGRHWTRIRVSHVGRAADDPYLILGVNEDTPNEDVKRAYRNLAKQHHPDALIARGVPEELKDLATERLAAINVAYAEVKAERGFT